MASRVWIFAWTAALAANWIVGPLPARADDTSITLSDGKLELTLPGKWEKKQPKFAGIVLHEFAAPAAEGDASGGRVTIGPAGGGLEANQRRWLAQFTQPDGSATADRAKMTKKQIAGCTVHLLDVSGTYQAPAFAPGGGGGQLPDYRMLAAIIDAGQRGLWYVRLYGPEKTIAAEAAEFAKVMDSLKTK